MMLMIMMGMLVTRESRFDRRSENILFNFTAVRTYKPTEKVCRKFPIVLYVQYVHIVRRVHVNILI